MSDTRALDESRLAYSVSTAAAVVSLSRASVYREISAGRLHAIKVGTRTLIARSELQRWLGQLAAHRAND